MRLVITAIVLASFLLPSDHVAYAAESSPSESKDDSGVPLYLSLFGGDFSADPDRSRLRRSGGAYGWGLTAGYFVNNHLSFEGEFLWFRREYVRISDTVIPGTANNESRVLSMGFFANTRLSHRFSRWRPFVSGGIGLVESDLFTTDPDSAKFTDAGPPASERSVAYHVSAGLSAHVRRGFHVEVGLRRIDIDADFGIYSNGDASLGGHFFFVAFRGGGF